MGPAGGASSWGAAAGTSALSPLPVAPGKGTGSSGLGLRAVQLPLSPVAQTSSVKPVGMHGGLLYPRAGARWGCHVGRGVGLPAMQVPQVLLIVRFGG